MIRKCKSQMPCNPPNINHFLKKQILPDTQYPHKSKHQHNTTTKSQKLKKLVWTWRDDSPIRRTSTYERPCTHEGNYLVCPC